MSTFLPLLIHSNGRLASEPLGGPTVLLGEPNGPGFGLRTDGEL
jgi:hypothetical protein